MNIHAMSRLDYMFFRGALSPASAYFFTTPRVAELRSKNDFYPIFVHTRELASPKRTGL